MKIISYSVILILATIFTVSCGNKGNAKKENQAATGTFSAADTGFTGIKQYMSKQMLIKEVSFKNGVREGLMKSFYQSGKLRQTFWYTNGLREDSAKWYYEDGRVFRSTPYKRDTADGIQVQYYRSGKVKARIGYSKGLRTPYFEEFDQNSKLVKGYPEMVVSTQDEYLTKGRYRISLSLSDKSDKVKFYCGEFNAGVFDTARCETIKTIKGIGVLDLKKSGTAKAGSAGVIAEILTNFGNKYLVYKKIDLPYKDLN
jgi:hypothetical protein